MHDGTKLTPFESLYANKLKNLMIEKNNYNADNIHFIFGRKLNSARLNGIIDLKTAKDAMDKKYILIIE